MGGGQGEGGDVNLFNSFAIIRMMSWVLTSHFIFHLTLKLTDIYCKSVFE